MESTLQQLTPAQLSIGQGVTFPIQISSKKVWQLNLSNKKWEEVEVRGWYPISGDTDLIRNNLQGCLLYQIGQRLRQEEFGNNLESCLEEPSTQVLVFFIENMIRTLISRYEDRITYKNTNIYTPKPGILYIRVQYQVRDDTLEEYLDFAINKD